MLKKIFCTTAVILSAWTAQAAATEWWHLVRSARGVMEVCQDKSDPNVSSPAVALEFFKGIGVPSSIEEKDLYDYYDLGYVVPATGKPVREVRVLNITKDGSKAYIAFYRTLEECQVVAKFWQDGKSLEDKELKKYR